MTNDQHHEKVAHAPTDEATMKPDRTSRPAVIARTYLRLVKGFARDHRLITLGLIATVAAHVAYELWNQPGEAPVALGMAVIVGYAGVLSGAVRAFVQQRRKRR